MFPVVYSPEAREDLKSLDHVVAYRIVKKIGWYSEQELPLKFAKKLINMGQERFRFRIGDYRAIFKLDEDGTIKVIMILKIKHRREVYE